MPQFPYLGETPAKVFISPLTLLLRTETIEIDMFTQLDSVPSILHLDCFKSFLIRFFAHVISPLPLHCFIFLKQRSDQVTLINKIIHCLFTSINKTPEQSPPQSVHLALYCICTLLFSSFPLALVPESPNFLSIAGSHAISTTEKAITSYPHSYLDFLFSIVHLVNTQLFVVKDFI